MRSIDEFRAFYRNDLRPVLEQFEARRLKIRGTLLAVGAVASVAAAGAVLALKHTGPVAFFLPPVLALIAVIVAWWRLTRGFVPEFKHRVIGPIVQWYDPGLTYAPKRHISQSRFRASEIFQHGIDRYSGEDLVAGRVGATQVEFSEVDAEYKTTSTDSKGRRQTHWHTIFKGLFFIADFNKHFRGTTVVLPDVAERLFGWLGQKMQSMNFTRGELVKLEDPEFEKEFVVYGDDQVEARYILSASLMARITDFKRKSGLRIYLSFVGSMVHLAIDTTRDMFEPRIWGTVLDPTLAEDYFRDLQLAVGIVEDLNLNTRIWTKQ